MAIHTQKTAEKYNQLNNNDNRFGRTDYLVTRELPKMIEEHAIKSTILDIGCGAGLSTRFIKKLGYDCIGIDINEEMLHFARTEDPLGNYVKSISESDLPFNGQTFDMVISVFVLFEISSIKKLTALFMEISRILKQDGVFIAVTGSEELYKRDWLTLDVKNFPENINPESGDICKINLTNIGLLLHDYFWTNNDYTYVAENSGFVVTKRLYPLGEVNEGIDWKDELYYPPFVFYEFKKSN